MKNYGLIIPPITNKEEGAEHLLGSIPKLRGVVINESGDWTQWLPDKEPQNVRGVETNACTIYASLNAIETLLKFKGYNVNYSDRYLANVAKSKGILNPAVGADPHRVAELIRNVAGCLKEDRLPSWTDDIKTAEDYYTLQNLYELMKEGERWYDEWEFSHEWLFNGGTPQEKRKKIEEGLKKGTVCVSVVAWLKNEQGFYYKPQGTIDGHWTMTANAQKDRYTIFDSYDGFIKPLVPDYDFSIAKVYYLTPAQEKRNILYNILELLKKILFLDLILIKKKEVIVPDEVLPPPAVKDDFNPPPNSSRVPDFARAIQKQEGWFPGSRSYRNKNPGNLKWSGLTKELGAIEKDKDFFCIFPGYVKGFTALCDFLKLACEDKLKPYRQARTLKRFCEVYANPPPNNGYATGIARDLNIELDTDIKTLL